MDTDTRGEGGNRSHILQEIVRGDERRERNRSVLQEKAALQDRIDQWEEKRAGQDKREFVCDITGVRVSVFKFSHHQANDVLKGRDHYLGTLRRRIHVDERFEDEKNQLRQARLDDTDRLYYRQPGRKSSNIKQVTAPENLAESLLLDGNGCFLGRTNIHLAGHRIQIPCDGLYTNTDYLHRGTHVFARLPKLDAPTNKKKKESKMAVEPVYLNTEGYGDPREWTHQLFGGVVYEYQDDGNYTIQTYYQGNLIRNVPRRYLQELIPEFQRALQKMLQGFRRAALVSLFASVKSHPLHQPSYRMAMSQLLEFGRVKDAINLGRRAVHLVPNSSRLQYLLGIALMRAFQFSDAIMAFRIGLRLDPYDNEIASMLTAAEMKARVTASNYNEAVPELHQLFDEDPGSMSLIKDVKRLQDRLRYGTDELPPIEGDTSGAMKRYSSQNQALTVARLALISYLKSSAKSVTMFFCRGTSRTIYQNRLYCSNASGSLLYERPKHFGKDGYNVPASLQQITVGKCRYILSREVSLASYHKILIGSFYDPSLQSADRFSSLKKFQDVCFNFALIGDLGTAMNPISRRRSSVIKANMAITEEGAPAPARGEHLDTQPQFEDNFKEVIRRRSVGPLPYEYMIPSNQEDETLYSKFAENLVPPHRREGGGRTSIGVAPPDDSVSSEAKDYKRMGRRWSLTTPRTRPSVHRRSTGDGKVRRASARRRLSLPAAYGTTGEVKPNIVPAEDYPATPAEKESDSEPDSDSTGSHHPDKDTRYMSIDAFDFFNDFIPSVSRTNDHQGNDTVDAKGPTASNESEKSNNEDSLPLTSRAAEALASFGVEAITSKPSETPTSSEEESNNVSSSFADDGDLRSSFETSSSPKENITESQRFEEPVSCTSTKLRSSSSFTHGSSPGIADPERKHERPQFRSGRILKQTQSASVMVPPRPPSSAKRLPAVEERQGCRPNSGHSESRDGRSSRYSTEDETAPRPISEDSKSKPRSVHSGRRIRKRTRIILTDEDIESDAESTAAFHSTRDIKLTEGESDLSRRKLDRPRSSNRLQFKRSDRYVAAKASLKTILQRTGSTLPSRINLMTEGSAVRASMLRYMESGQYYREVCLALKVARRYFRTKKAKEKDIVIFDIDDTALTSFAYFAQAQLERVPLASPDWFHLANSPPLYPVFEFYQFLRRRGYDIVFLSERPSYSLHHTKEALIRAGYDAFKHLIVRPEEEELNNHKMAKNVPLTASEFKFESRVSLRRQGYRICATVGDQSSDFAGEYTGFKVKLPNYCYIED
eukprot:gb/GECG01002917.1/.p1 GENE.gb/GECG01002917.1/~~gb/GECG01002917.1/.p1  ORF type:complete len:1282 (+),score=154.59 gb/GECG01002917.1/:1-3846(+)